MKNPQKSETNKSHYEADQSHENSLNENFPQIQSIDTNIKPKNKMTIVKNYGSDEEYKNISKQS